MRRLCLYIPQTAIETIREARNLGLLVGSPFHLTQLPSYNLAVLEWAGSPRFSGLVTGITTKLTCTCTSRSYERKPFTEANNTELSCLAHGHRCGLSVFDEYFSGCHCGSGLSSWTVLAQCHCSYKLSTSLFREFWRPIVACSPPHISF